MTEFLDNDDRLLRHAWHAVLRTDDLTTEADTLLLGETWTLSRRDKTVTATDRTGKPAWGVGERYGLIWLAPAEPVTDLPYYPEYDTDLAYSVIRRRTHAAAGVLIDNFLDVTHFSYLHQRTFGLVRPVTVERYDLDLGPWEVRLTHETRLHESSDPAGLSRVAVYLYHPPYVTHLRMSFPPGEGDDSASTLVCQPESATSTVAYVIVGWPAHDTPGLRAQVALSDAVLAEDMAMVEQIEDPRLPLAIRAELHTRADRAGVEMRRMLTSYLAACAGPALS
jgi:phenylpropionate dioxygenase-like ring-hydroxylating dioxygenase large terminal subunit